MNQTQTHSINSYDDKKLINLQVPNHIINTFDNLVKSNGVSRTSKLVEFMKLYIKQQFDEIDNIRIFNEKLNQIQQQNLERVSNKFEKKLEERVNKLTRKETIKTPIVQVREPVDLPRVEEDDIFTSKSTWTVVGNDYDD